MQYLWGAVRPQRPTEAPPPSATEEARKSSPWPPSKPRLAPLDLSGALRPIHGDDGAAAPTASPDVNVVLPRQHLPRPTVPAGPTGLRANRFDAGTGGSESHVASPPAIPRVGGPHSTTTIGPCGGDANADGVEWPPLIAPVVRGATPTMERWLMSALDPADGCLAGSFSSYDGRTFANAADLWHDVTRTLALPDAAAFVGSHGLSRDEAAACLVFTAETNVFSRANRALRLSDAAALAPYQPFLGHLMAAMAKLPRYDGVVYRAWGDKDIVRQYLIGSEVVWGQFSSSSPTLTPQQLVTFGQNRTSGSGSVAGNSTTSFPSGSPGASPASSGGSSLTSSEGEAGVVLVIEVAGGRRLGPLSLFPSEDEVVLPPTWRGVVRGAVRGQYNLARLMKVDIGRHTALELQQRGLPPRKGSLLIHDIRGQCERAVAANPADARARATLAFVIGYYCNDLVGAMQQALAGRQLGGTVVGSHLVEYVQQNPHLLQAMQASAAASSPGAPRLTAADFVGEGGGEAAPSPEVGTKDFRRRALAAAGGIVDDGVQRFRRFGFMQRARWDASSDDSDKDDGDVGGCAAAGGAAATGEPTAAFAPDALAAGGARATPSGWGASPLAAVARAFAGCCLRPDAATPPPELPPLAPAPREAHRLPPEWRARAACDVGMVVQAGFIDFLASTDLPPAIGKAYRLASLGSFVSASLGRLAEGRRFYEEAQELDPTFVSVNYGLLLEYKFFDVAAARRAYEHCVQVQLAFMEDADRLSAATERHGRPTPTAEGAGATWSASDLRSARRRLSMLLHRHYARKNAADREAARRLYEGLLGDAPDGELYGCLGVLVHNHFLPADPAEGPAAMRAYHAALRLDPNDADSRCNLAVLLMMPAAARAPAHAVADCDEAGDAVAALELLQAAARIAPREPRYWWHLARAHGLVAHFRAAGALPASTPDVDHGAAAVTAAREGARLLAEHFRGDTCIEARGCRAILAGLGES